MFSATVDQIMATNPCGAYTPDYVTQLFAGNESLTASQLLALDIPQTDQIALICKLGWLTPDQTAQILTAMLALITDSTSPYYARFQAYGTPYGFGAICGFLNDTQSQDLDTSVNQIAALVISLITPMVTA